MRLFGAIVLLAFVSSLSGCTVPTTYSKSISVKKDASGNILERVETETVVQPGQGYPVQFELFQGVQPSASSQEAIEKSHKEFRRNK